MLRILVTYDTSDGQTEKVAHHVARQIERRGQAARLVNLDSPDDKSEIGDFDASFIIGAVHGGQHSQRLTEFVRSSKQSIERTSNAFLSVSLSAASHETTDKLDAEAFMQEFERETGWTPQYSMQVAGALHERQFGWFQRTIVRVLLKQRNIVPEPSGETELTNWPALDDFVRMFVEQVVSSTAHTS